MADGGQLHVLDSETVGGIDALQVINEWAEPEEWQEARPAIQVGDDVAASIDPEEQVIHAVDLVEVEIIESSDFDLVPNAFTAVEGKPAAGVTDEY